MIYYSKYRKYKKKYLSLRRKMLGGMPELPNSEHEILNFIKLLVKNNIQNRYEQNPSIIREYTIGPHNIDRLNQFVDSIHTFEDFCNPILESIFSKGCVRLLEFIKFMNNGSLWKNMNKYKVLLIAQFIIINQIFGDGNHRAAIYVLDHYSTYSPEYKSKIMVLTERIHKWDGDLKKKQFWIQQKLSEFEYYLPDFTKVEQMITYI
jgi:hypothetical protein